MIMGQPTPQPNLSFESIARIIAGVQMREPQRANPVQNIPTHTVNPSYERNFEQIRNDINELRERRVNYYDSSVASPFYQDDIGDGRDDQDVAETEQDDVSVLTEQAPEPEPVPEPKREQVVTETPQLGFESLTVSQQDIVLTKTMISELEKSDDPFKKGQLERTRKLLEQMETDKPKPDPKPEPSLSGDDMSTILFMKKQLARFERSKDPVMRAKADRIRSLLPQAEKGNKDNIKSLTDSMVKIKAALKKESKERTAMGEESEPAPPPVPVPDVPNIDETEPVQAAAKAKKKAERDKKKVAERDKKKVAERADVEEAADEVRRQMARGGLDQSIFSP
tara:strand:+ start:7158 stop:8171 length:1014 start_codon:yes stop_codon:yes gene_type:complete